MITHDIAAARRLCHRIAVMEAGRIVEEGPAVAIVAAPQSAAARALVAAHRQAKGGGHGPPPFDISAKLRS